MVKRYLVLLSVLFLMIGCSSNNSSQGSEATKPLPRLDPASVPLYPAVTEAKAKDFKVTLVNGEAFQLSEQKGKVVLLNIWATWCAPCHVETPEFVDLYSKYRDNGLQILGISIDEQGKAVVKPFMEKYDVNYPIVIDNGTIMEKYGPTMGVPTTYIIGKDGNLKYFAVGALTRKELEPRLKKLLEM